MNTFINIINIVNNIILLFLVIFEKIFLLVTNRKIFLN